MENEQAEMKEQEEDANSQLVRKSRNGNESKISEIADVDGDNEVSDGVSEFNGHSNGDKNEGLLLTSEKVQKIDELDGVLENESDAINGEEKSEDLVFLDKVEGIWKCRICTWTYGNGSVCVDRFQNHKGLLHKLMNIKTLNFESEGVESDSTYLEEKQILKDPEPEKHDVSSLDFVVQNNSNSAINNNHGADVENNISSSSSEISSPHEHSTSHNKSSNEIESAEVDLIDEDDLEIAESDVERVIKKQTTHDLYCPNCNSCITKKVILKKRKRRIRVSHEEVKRNKTNAAVDSILSKGSVQSREDRVLDTHVGDDNDAQIPLVDEDERERGPDIFRCLSCFSFFIPSGNGFKLFRLFGEKSEKVEIRDEQAQNIKKNWFTSIFASNKHETNIEQGSSFQTNVHKDDVGVLPSSNLGDQIQSGEPSFSQKARSTARASEELVRNNDILKGGDQILPYQNQKPSLNGTVINGAGDQFDMTRTERVDAFLESYDTYAEDTMKGSKSNKEEHVYRENDISVTTLSMSTQASNSESKQEAVSFSQQGGLKLLISSNDGALTLENSDVGPITNQTMLSGGADKDAIQLSPPTVSVLKASDVDGNLNISLSIPHEEQDVRATILTESVLENKNANFSSDSGQINTNEISQHLITKTKFEVHSGEPLKVDNISVLKGVPLSQGKDIFITIDSQQAGLPQYVRDMTSSTLTESLLQSSTQSTIAGRERTEERNEYEIEVIKSIVYGGLAESVTSLSVVSSAAGGGAATLNVLALGMANLVGGLFIICHNLWELKSDRIEQVANQVANQVPDQRDRYKELLGRRQNLILHAIVSIISYIVFGLVPPLVYGFSFRKSDDKQLKLVVVGATSLLCIVILAIARAHVRRPPKPYLKSVVTFVILGFMVSGVSYAAGELVERLLVKLGVFETSKVSDLLVPKTMVLRGSTWSSY